MAIEILKKLHTNALIGIFGGGSGVGNTARPIMHEYTR
jgi:hypothetical protein